MVIRVSLALTHTLWAQGLESYLRRQADIVLTPPPPPDHHDGDTQVQAGDVVLIGLDSLHPSALEQLRAWHDSPPPQRWVVLADFRQPSELLGALDAGALACVSTTSQLEDVLQAIRAASQGEHYLCQQLSTLMLQGARRQRGATRERHGLGLREEEVLRLIADGYSSKEIARQLEIAPSTVDVHRRNIMRKIGLHKVADLTRFAIRHQMISL